MMHGMNKGACVGTSKKAVYSLLKVLFITIWIAS